MTVTPMPSGNGRDPYSLLGAQIDELTRRVDAAETARTPVLTSAQADLNNSNAFSGAWTEVLAKVVDVPRGYSQCYVLLAVAAGQSAAGSSGSATIGAWPRITGGGNTYVGPGISNGITGAGSVSISSFVAQLVSGLTPGSQIRLATWSYSQATTLTVPALSANAHLSASLMFLR